MSNKNKKIVAFLIVLIFAFSIPLTVMAEAAKNASKFNVSTKHLSSLGGRYAKFATNSRSQVQTWVSQALKSSKATFHPNSSNSYYIITKMGKVIGTKGEKYIKVVFDSSGRIWTAFPVK